MNVLLITVRSDFGGGPRHVNQLIGGFPSQINVFVAFPPEKINKIKNGAIQQYSTVL